MPHTIDALDAIAVLARLAALERRVAALESSRGTNRAGVELVPVIAAAVGERAFSAAELVAHSAVDPDLRAALAAANLTSPRRLGWALRRLDGRVIHGLRLAQIGSDRAGRVWCIFPARNTRTL
jgi:hypothetical protein